MVLPLLSETGILWYSLRSSVNQFAPAFCKEHKFGENNWGYLHKADSWGMAPHTDQNLQGTYSQALHKAVFDKGWAFGWTAGGPF